MQVLLNKAVSVDTCKGRLQLVNRRSKVTLDKEMEGRTLSTRQSVKGETTAL